MSALNKKIATAAMLGISVSAAVAGCANTDPAPDSSSTATSRRPAYENGDYRATGQYGSGPSSITVSLTLDDGAITAVEVTPHATDPTSRDYQERFADAVPRLVVGKKIDDVHLDHVAGSSLTPDGFNAALQQIKGEAAG
ncbi:FMN-binding protein [Streptomyces sp. NPDC101234]|uniref:FMN-binding protein n=1 Tax=Streptomyces sp. NPDC101234 TaxID=3366138 RepID=UPI0038121A11